MDRWRPSSRFLSLYPAGSGNRQDTSCHSHLALRIISVLVLALFSWSFVGLCDIAHAVDRHVKQAARENVKPKGHTHAEKLERAVEEVDRLLADPAAEPDVRAVGLKAKRVEIEEIDQEVRAEFAKTEKKLKDAKLPPEILDRHVKFIKHYEENLQALRGNLEAVDRAESPEEADTGLKKTRAHLSKVKPPKKHKPLDPHKLPHRVAEPTHKKPRLKKEEFEKEFKSEAKPVLIASAAESLAGLLVAQAATPPNLPTPADLAETIEVQFTPEIKAKAQELGHNPVKIYNWVRNNVEFVPTYGSIQGAQMCLLTKQCNAFDMASLLIALLRASGIHARYILGTIELPTDKVMNWAGGFTDPKAAIEFISAGGIPVTGLVKGGKIAAVQMEHVWVEAWVDYLPSRGAVHKQGDTWIPLDASFKQYNYTPGVDIRAAVPFDSQAFLDTTKATAVINEQERYVTGLDTSFINQAVLDYQSLVESYLTQNHPGATVGDVLGKRQIVKQEFPFLLGTLPYKSIVTGQKTPEIANSLRHKLTIELYQDPLDELLGKKVSVTKSLPELAGKRLTLRFAPSTETDKALLDSYYQDHALSVPAYLVHLKAELKVEDTVLATGPDLMMGTDQLLTLSFTGPALSDVDTYRLRAGDHAVVGLNLGSGKGLFFNRVALNDFSDSVSEMLYHIILGYWAEYDTLSEIFAKAQGVGSARLPSHGVSSAPISVEYLFGLPFAGHYSSKALDVKRDKVAVTALDGQKDRARDHNRATGIVGSLFEGVIYDQMLGYEIGNGVSAVRILQLSNAQGVPLYHVNNTNINAVVPNLKISSSAVADITNAVNAGKEVIVPKENITHKGWIGTGYIVLDPEVGDGGYIIDGGAAGAAYMGAARSVAVFGEHPHADDVKAAITGWTTAVGPAVLAIIGATIAIDIPALLLGATTLLALMIVCMAVVIIAAVIDTIIKTQVPQNFKIFRHYTTHAGKVGILASRVIWASDDGDLGPGAYVTDFFKEPDNGGKNSQEIADAIHWLKPVTDIQTYVTLKIDLVRKPLINGASKGYPLQWVYPKVALPIDGVTVIAIQ